MNRRDEVPLCFGLYRVASATVMDSVGPVAPARKGETV